MENVLSKCLHYGAHNAAHLPKMADLGRPNLSPVVDTISDFMQHGSVIIKLIGV